MSSRYVWHHKKGVIISICVAGGYMWREIMVRVSWVRVRRGSRNGRVRKNGQPMNQFVQVTLLKKASHV